VQGDQTLSASNWLSVGEFANAVDAELTSQRLTTEAIPNKIVASNIPHLGTGPYWVWVPEEFHHQARRVLTESAVPEEELSRLALATPPPDDL
jgi:hypothetical protein